MNTDKQLDLFRNAVALLGGATEASRQLDISVRAMSYLLAGERRLHDGILVDICRALIDHAAKCRDLERRLSPAFADNRVPGQERKPLHAGKNRDDDDTTSIDGAHRIPGLDRTT